MEMSVNMVGVDKIVESLHAQGKAAGLTIKHLAWEVMADACNDMLRLSPPRTEGGGGWGKQKKIGEAAVASDLKALFEPQEVPGTVWFFNPATQKYYRRSASQKDRRILLAVPAGRVLEDHEIPTVHRMNLNRKGRVPRRPIVSFVHAKALKRYVKDIKTHVGKLKSGWLAAADYFCGKVGKQRKAPAWVVRHGEACSYKDTITDAGDGYLRADNLAPTAGAVRKDTLDFVMRTRQRDIDKWLPKRAEKIAARISAAETDATAVTA